MDRKTLIKIILAFGLIAIIELTILEPGLWSIVWSDLK